jgi:HK97 family phage major capsid protein
MKTTLKDLLEQRASKTKEMRAIVDTPAGEGGDLSAEQSQRFDSLKTEIDALEKQIDRRRLIDEAERRMAGTTIAGTGDRRLDEELRSFSLVRAIASQVPDLRDKIDTGREIELSAELARRAGRPFQGIAVPLAVFHQRIEQRVITTALPGGGPGSNIIATDHLGNQFIDRLRAALRVRQLGATVLSNLVGNVDVPRLKASATAGWVAENSALTASDQQFDKVQLTPKHCGAITEFSRNMLMQSSPDIEQLVRNDFRALMAEAVDRVAIKGGGSNEPTGVLGTSGIGSVAMGANGGPITWSAAVDVIAEVEIDNAMGSAFLTNSKVVKSARKTAKVASTDSVMVMEEPNALAGYPLGSTNLVPSDLTKGTSSGVCSALIFGNWADLLLGYWSELDVLVNPYESTAYSKGNVQVRGMLTMDVDVRHPESFAAIQDLTTA